jgi:3-oxoacyl-[acyl-carrier-protein] synthase III
LKILTTAFSMPKRIVSNDEVIDIIRKRSADGYGGNLEHDLKMIRRFLVGSGLEERRWCADGEQPRDHIVAAIEAALDESQIAKDEIDLVIYVGIGKGFAEPGNSHIIAGSLGMHNAQCFDITDACMSWMRALHIVDTFFKAGIYKNALVINGEFLVTGNNYVYPDNYSLKYKDEIEYSLPSYTFGEAATATVLLPDNQGNFEFHFSARTDLYDLCTIPMDCYWRYCDVTNRIGKRSRALTSFGSELHQSSQPEVRTILKTLSKIDDIDLIFVHASSKKEWAIAATAMGVESKVHHIYPWTGNLVSASVPVAMRDALDKGILDRGKTVCFWVGSAGMSFGAAKFVY